MASVPCAGEPIAIFTTTAGTGTEFVTYDGSGQKYRVNWHTDRSSSALVAGHYYRVSVRVAGTRLGFLDVAVLSGGAEVRNYRTGDVIPLVNGRTLPIQFRIEQGAVAAIGSAGGTAVLEGGAVKLVFPEGAVATEIGVTATAKPVGGDGTDTSVLPGTRFDFQPSPSEFEEPIALTLRYPSSLPPHMHAGRLAVCKMVNGVCRAIAGSQVDLVTRTVTAQITSFSEYGVTEWPEIVRYVGSTVDGMYLSTATGDQHILDGGSGHGNWSPDGTRFATVVTLTSFSQYEAIRQTDAIRIVNADGTGLMTLASGGVYRDLRWSPDGAEILFHSLEFGPMYVYSGNYWTWDQTASTLMVMSSAGGGLRSVAEVPHPSAAHWSPDGQQIAFSGSWNGSACVCSINRDGTGLRAIATLLQQGIPDADDIAWSPDGHQVAFISMDGAIAGLWVVSADGANPQRIVVSQNLRGVSWSPIGEDLLLYSRSDFGEPDYDGTSARIPTGVYSARSDGSGERLLLEYARTGGVQSWDPVGSRVAVHFNGHISVVNLDGSGVQQVGSLSTFEDHPYWRP